jgi:hypothetical protein
MTKKNTEELTVREAAERLGAAIPTVTLMCREGRFPNARQDETPRGPIWYIPVSDLAGIEVRGRGRPATAKTEQPETENGQATKRAAKKGGRK